MCVCVCVLQTFALHGVILWLWLIQRNSERPVLTQTGYHVYTTSAFLSRFAYKACTGPYSMLTVRVVVLEYSQLHKKA